MRIAPAIAREKGFSDVPFADGAANDTVTDASKHALAMRVIAEMAAIDMAISSLRMQGGADAEHTIGELQASQSVLLSSLRDVQHARHAGDLKQVVSHVGVALRHSTEARCAATSAVDTVTKTAKTVAQALAAPMAGGVAIRFAGKAMGAGEYRTALGMLTRQGQSLIDGFKAHIEAQADAAAKHMVDIGRSQQTQATLIEQAREAYVQGAPAEAATRIGEAATLGLRDAERVKAAHSDAITEALVGQAQLNATQATRHAVDQLQVDARRDCTEQGKKGEALEACTVDASALKIEALRVRMIRIQLQVDTPEDEATERANRILRGVAPHDAPQLLLGKARAESDALKAATGVRMTVTEVDITQVRITADTPDATNVQRPPHVMGPR